MMGRRWKPHTRRTRGMTMIEVLVATLLIFLGLGSVFAMNAQSMHSLRIARQAGAASQILQQRVEMLRSRPWPEVSSALALSRIFQSPTESESELADSEFREAIRVSIPTAPNGATFEVARQRGAARVNGYSDFGSEMSLLFESTVTWNDARGAHNRSLRTVITRSGLTRSGIFGNLNGRPDPSEPPSVKER